MAQIQEYSNPNFVSMITNFPIMISKHASIPSHSRAPEPAPYSEAHYPKCSLLVYERVLHASYMRKQRENSSLQKQVPLVLSQQVHVMHA